MYKTRTLPVDYGRMNDCLYTPGSLTYAKSGELAACLQYPDWNIMGYYGSGISSRYNAEEANRNTEFAYMYAASAGQETFNSSENRKPQFNNCDHVKTAHSTYYPFTLQWDRYNNEMYYHIRKYDRMSDYKAYAVPWDYTSGITSFGDYTSASRRAWWEMQPRFEGEVSMLNFIFELKDFRDLAKASLKLRSLSSISTEMRKFKQKLRRIDSKLMSKTSPVDTCFKVGSSALSAAKVGAQARLINEFALKPLISDWANILAQSGEIVRNVQKEFQKKGLSDQVRHYSETYYKTNTASHSTNAWYGWGTKDKSVFTATLEYHYDYSMRSDSDAFLKYWGLKVTPEVIWNAIPFSFLADYFLKIGKSIHAMKTDPNVSLLKTQYCESILRTYDSGYVTVAGPNVNLVVNGVENPSDGSCITGITGTHYKRRVTAPNRGSAIPRISLPSGRQGANMAALAVCFIK